jgi:TonB family protein
MMTKLGTKGSMLAIMLSLIFGGCVATGFTAHAQETAADATKRKVKTRATPDYPVLAKQMNVTGKVKIEATISPDGRVTATHVVGGSPILVSSAVDALKKWRYEPGPKETTEIVEFNFGGN